MKLGFCGAVLALTVVPAQAYFIQNGGFEDPVIAGYFQNYASGLSGWTIASGDVDLIREYWVPAAGAQSLDLNGTTPGVIQQDFVATAGSFAVRFDLAGNPDSGDAKPVQVTLENLTNPNTWTWNVSFDQNGYYDQNMGWKTITSSSVDLVAGESYRLAFTSQALGQQGAALDNIDIVAVPEPAHYASIGCGLLGLVFLGRNYLRNRKSA